MTHVAIPHLLLVRGALAQIERYKPTSYDEFLLNEMAQDAILMRLQEIGENLSRVRQIDEVWFRNNAPNSWNQIIGLRHIISHGYHTIEPGEIWQILTEEIQDFRRTIEQALDAVSDSSESE